MHVREFYHLDFTVQDWAFFQKLLLFLRAVKKFKLKYLGFESKNKSRDIWRKRMMQGYILGWRSKERQGIQWPKNKRKRLMGHATMTPQ